jgi:small-conductance mechanosensitive channel
MDDTESKSSQDTVINIKPSKCKQFKDCCKFRIAERDWSGSFFKLKMLFMVAIIFGIGVAIDFSDINKKFWGESIEIWMYLLASIFAALYVGAIVDYVIFFLIDIVLYFNKTTHVFYYINAFEGYIGPFIMNIFFLVNYDKVFDNKHNSIDRVSTFLIFLILGFALHNLLIKIVMRKSLLKYFDDKINEILLYKNLILRLSGGGKQDNTFGDGSDKELLSDKDKDINWKLIKVKDYGFLIWIAENQQIEIHKSQRMIQFAEQIWNVITEKLPMIRDSIETDKLMEWCGVVPNDKHYSQILSVFDPNDDTTTSKTEFINGILLMFRSWKYLKASLTGQNAVSKAVSVLSGALFWFIELLIFLNIFNIPSDTVFVPVLTLMVSLSFAIGGIVTKFVSSLIFIGSVHPYNIGDKIQCQDIKNGNTLLVKEINILTTTVMETCSGKIAIIPNYILMDQVVINLAKSTESTLTLVFSIGSNSSKQQLDYLKQNIKAFISEKPFEWKPNLDLILDEADPSTGKMKITIWVSHHGEWMQGRKIMLAKTELILYILEQMKYLHIEYQEFDIPIVLKNKID